MKEVNNKSSLETQRLILRAWKISDNEPFYRMNSNPLVMRFFPNALTLEESDATVDRIMAHFVRHGFGPYAAEIRSSGEFAGFIGLSFPNFDAHFMLRVEIGWRLAPEFWNQGFATEGARAVLCHGFGHCGLEEIVSFTVPANTPSRRVMEKIGMTYSPTDDFDHPKIAAGHPLRRHVLYRIRKEQFNSSL